MVSFLFHCTWHICWMWATVLACSQPEVWDAWICAFELEEYMSDNGTAGESVPTVQESVPFCAYRLHWAFNSVTVTIRLCIFERHEMIKFVQYILSISTVWKRKKPGPLPTKKKKEIFQISSWLICHTLQRIHCGYSGLCLMNEW